MAKRRVLVRILLALLVLILGSYYLVQKQASGYQSQHTIRTGELRKTTFSLVSSAENSTMDYQKQYSYIEDIGDGRGYTAGIIGFTTATGDLRQVVLRYQRLSPKNKLVAYLPALQKVQGTSSHKGLGKQFVTDWKKAAHDKKFIQAQDDILDQQYMKPALKAAKEDDLGPLGQYIYYDAIVVHGPGNDVSSFGGIRKKAKKLSKSPIQGINQAVYLRTFLNVRSKVMRQESAHHDLSRINAQREFIKERNFRLRRPLTWKMYGDSYHLNK
ncbi:chitosanase [Companilactobacillus kimchiensis]|uniref:chitosanase n=1 Tax=Companilactobacillus kimchiensis TaxID=993692 RepID=UPI00070A0020|nr:chitosanase [Companilactobacillus kimchiensis]